MSANGAESQESYECSECGDTFDTERGRDSHVEQVHGRPYHDEDVLRDLYVERGLSSIDIAEKFDVSYRAITNSLRRNGIEVRSTQETYRQKAPEELRNAEALRDLYHDGGLTTAEIAGRVGVSQSTVTLWMHRHGIKAETRVPRGDDHWWATDSEAGIDYGENWYQQSQRARERDGHTCQVCGHTPDADDRALDVHHIQPVRTFDKPEEGNTLNNLITLCRSCHQRWEGIPLRPEGVE